MYVKLRDKGTMFHDASQDATVTGQNPVAVKKTRKVAAALRSGILVEVDAKEAKLALANNKAEAVKANAEADKNAAKLVKEAEDKAAEAEGKLADAEARATDAETKLAEAEAKLAEIEAAKAEEAKDAKGADAKGGKK